LHRCSEKCRSSGRPYFEMSLYVACTLSWYYNWMFTVIYLYHIAISYTRLSALHK
jgi:hypothetical protein